MLHTWPGSHRLSNHLLERWRKDACGSFTPGTFAMCKFFGAAKEGLDAVRHLLVLLCQFGTCRAYERPAVSLTGLAPLVDSTPVVALLFD